LIEGEEEREQGPQACPVPELVVLAGSSTPSLLATFLCYRTVSMARALLPRPPAPGEHIKLLLARLCCRDLELAVNPLRCHRAADGRWSPCTLRGPEKPDRCGVHACCCRPAGRLTCACVPRSRTRSRGHG
jgi:hypothetical protein